MSENIQDRKIRDVIKDFNKMLSKGNAIIFTEQFIAKYPILVEQEEIISLKAKNKALLEALEDYLYSGIIQGMSENSMHYADVSQKCLCLKCINKRAKKAIQGG